MALRPSSLTTAITAAALAGASACHETPRATGRACELLPGDLVVSEIMVDPRADDVAPTAAGDAAGEWIEIYNASSRPLALDRVVVTVSGGGRRPQIHELRGAGSLAPQSYFVLGAGGVRGHLDYVYGSALELTNTGAVLTLSCRGRIVDTVAYGALGAALVPPGVSLSLDGARAPDALANDSPENWCPDAESHDGASAGTPGSANETCGVLACREDGALRSVVGPVAGDLVVSEVFADPTGADDTKEWLELYVAGGASVDLNAIVLEVATVSAPDAVEVYRLAAVDCRRVAPGGHVVLGAAVDPARNGGIPVDFAVPGLRLPQHEDLQLRLVSGAELVDAAVVPAPLSGWAVRLDDAHKTADANDATEAYCLAAAVAPAGTPGDANGLCGTLSCRERGVARTTRRAAAGELIVSEVFARSSRSNPPGGGRDWLELYVAGARELDLNGLTITSTNRASGTSVQVTLASEECVPVAPGSYPVIAYSLDPAATGGVGATYAAPALALANEGPLRIELRYGEAFVDRAEVPSPELGNAAALDPASMIAEANDIESAFCFSQALFVFDEQGTPGRPNLCGPLCTDEGGQRPLVSPAPGDLVITEIFPDPFGADAARDWIEVYVTASVDLNGLILRNGVPGAERSWILASPPGLPADACLRVAVDEPGLPGRFVVLGGAAAASFGVTLAATFGGASDTLLYSPSYVPKNAMPADKAVRLEMETVVLDEAFYPFGLPEGRSFALAPDVLDASGNDDPARWCASTASLMPPSQVDTGTPGAPNPDRCE